MLADIFATAFDNADVWVYISDFHTGEILFINHKFASFVGEKTKNMIGKKCWTLVNPKGVGRCSFCPYEKLVDKKGEPLDKYTWELDVPRSNMWVKVTNQAVRWVDGRLANITTFYDITEFKKTQARLADVAFVDPMLSLDNILKLTLDVADAPVKPSLIVFDIQSLHKINEAYGREAGDSLLTAVRDWVLSCNIPNSHLYRIGGDEFCLAIEESELQFVTEFADRLYQRFSKPWLEYLSDVSIGVILSDYLTGAEILPTLIERTLKVAKSGMKIVVYNDDIKKEYKRHLDLELSLKRCVNNGMEGFEVYYQPIVDPVTGRWCALEALCRWNSPELGVIPPLIFIPEAERLHLIGPIGLWVLESAVNSCKAWGLDKNEGFMLNVNFSAIQFSDELLASKVLKVLDTYDYPCCKLSVEITESTQFTFSSQSLGTINALRSNNIQIALDDFGSGYSSFNNLNCLPVDVLKIERLFVSNIEIDNYQRCLFKTMAELAHAVNMKLIAEGVENNEQKEILLENGADFMQGFLFSEPLPSEQLKEQLNRFNS